MKKLQDWFHNHSLRFQLTSWFLLISLLPLIWITYVTYQISKNILTESTEEHLHALGIKQINLFKAFFSEKERNASALAKELITPEMEQELDVTIKQYGKDSKEYKAALNKLVPNLVKRAKAFNYRNFILVDDDGTVVLSLAPQLIEPGLNLLHPINHEQKILEELFQRSRTTLRPQVSPMIYYNPRAAPGIFISTPLASEDGKLIGIIIFQINNSAIYELLQNFQGLGNTGEVLIAAHLDSELIIVSSFFKDEFYPRIYRINPDSSFGKFVQQVLSGIPSIEEVKDYHGNMTIAVGKKVNPVANWAVITKVDRNVLINPVIILKYISWILLILTTILVTIIAAYVARKIAIPILALIKKTKLMAAGDLTQRIHIPYHNEMGKLGESFNEMASQLDHLIQHLDTLVAQRTEEVQNKNLQLNQTIAELKETQNRMIVQEKLASLGALTAGIAHEIKNPLNFVNNFAELSLQIHKDLNDSLEKVRALIPAEVNQEFKEELETLQLNLSKIYKHGKRADSIVHNMLQHSRSSAGERVKTDLNKLLDEYVDLAYHGVRAKDATFTVKIEKNYQTDLPEIVISPQEISRVFLNLLNNAFYSVNQKKQNEAAAYQPLVKITTELQDKNIFIKIWDNGLGIPEDIRVKLFTPFFTTKPSGEGTGLGLSLSYNIIAQGYGGTITIESELGQFAEFSIKFPVKE